FFGGIFPGIIHGTQNYQEGYILKKLPLPAAPMLVTGLEKEDFVLPDFQDWLAEMSETPSTLLVFIDGLTANIARCLDQLYHVFGNTVSFMGGGAGSLSLVPQPCVFTQEGIFQDAVLICPVQLNISLGVKHGWQKMMGPMVATKTVKNTIYELNWTNAFDLYKEAIEKDGGPTISATNFFDVAKAYPFGIFREMGEDIVRDPIAVGENGALICVGEVPENTVLYILKGANSALINAAQMATQECMEQVEEPVEHTLVVDCISRTLFLQEDFSKELQQINQVLFSGIAGVTPEGVLSLGEISSYGSGVLEFYNKTLVVGALY
ncbi:MAG: FIST C-terminal domain-containing protein, partial [Bacteroidota bacterium]